MQMVRDLIARGTIKTGWMAKTMRKVKRELFMPKKYKEQAYLHENIAFSIPPYTSEQTISAPGTYPMFYEPLELKRGDKVLEVGTGSGYGAALLREIVGKEGKIVTIERNRITYEFGKKNLQKAGYKDVLVVHGDGTKGYPSEAPYDKICVTASFVEIPKPLKDQLTKPGKLIMPVGPKYSAQDLVLLEKDGKGKVKEKVVSSVIYVPLVGEYGYERG